MTYTPVRTAAASNNPFDLGGFFSGMVNNLMNPQGKSNSDVERSRKSWEQFANLARANPNADPAKLLNTFGEHSRQEWQLNQAGAEANLNRTLRAGQAGVGLYGERKDIDTENEIKGINAKADARDRGMNTYATSQMPILDKSIEGELALSGQQNDMVRGIVDAYDRQGQRAVDYNKWAIEQNKSSLIDKLIGTAVGLAPLFLS